MSDLKDTIFKYALENAVKFKGRANPGALVGKLLQDDPSLKQKMGEVSKQINEIIKEVNELSPDEQKSKLLELEPDYFEDQKEQKEQRKEQRKDLPELRNAEMGKVVTRISPEPSKYSHLGHAVSFLLNYMYAVKYEGKCILRFEDTNPEKSSQEYVDSIKEDVLNYLDIKVSDTVIVSDHMDKYYDFAQKLVDNGAAYTCTCIGEVISANRREMKACSCQSESNTKEDWDKMKAGEFKEGEITLRLKIDMEHKNAVMRDPVIFRLSYVEHYKQKDKYKVWPMYDFENAIEEGLQKITHVMRSNEFDSRIELQDHIRSLFDLPNPEVKQYARVNVAESTTKGREIRELIESGDYIGWDDPRLVTLKALKRRGIVKEAFYELAKVVGMSKTNSTLDFSVIAAINRSLLDESAKRFFFIADAQEVIIENAPVQNLELDLHPHHINGGRKFQTSEKFYLSKKDLDEIQDGELVRLMDCLNFRKEGDKFIFTSTDLNEYKKEGKKIIHWLPVDQVTEVQILQPDNTTIKGFAEVSVDQINVDDVIQFERYGFCRLDEKNKFWFTHN